MKGILGIITLLFSSGIVYVYFFRVVFWPLCIISLLLVCACFLLSGKVIICDSLILVLAFFSGALCLKNAYIISKSDISQYSFQNNKIYAIEGFVNSCPLKKKGRICFVFRATGLQFQNKAFVASGDIFVSSKAQKRLSYGDEALLIGSPTRNYYLIKNRGLSSVQAKGNTELVRLGKNRGRVFKKLAFYLRNKSGGVFKARLSPLASAITSAMVLGDKDFILPNVYDSMVKSGTMHIMVVSGFHVGVVAFISGLVLKVLRLNRKLRSLGIVFCMALYCFITGAAIPVVRATIMGIFLIMGAFLEKEQDIGNSLSLSALVILMVDPRSLFSISFQLSFASVTGIIYIYPALKRLFKIENIKIMILRRLAESLFISLAAWFGTAGFIAYYFKILTPIAILANILIIPTASLVIISGLVLFILDPLAPFLTGAFAAFNELTVFMLVKLSTFFSSLPFAYYRI